MTKQQPKTMQISTYLKQTSALRLSKVKKKPETKSQSTATTHHWGIPQPPTEKLESNGAASTTKTNHVPPANRAAHPRTRAHEHTTTRRQLHRTRSDGPRTRERPDRRRRAEQKNMTAEKPSTSKKRAIIIDIIALAAAVKRPRRRGATTTGGKGPKTQRRMTKEVVRSRISSHHYRESLHLAGKFWIEGGQGRRD